MTFVKFMIKHKLLILSGGYIWALGSVKNSLS